jgi:hypothetical protein
VLTTTFSHLQPVQQKISGFASDFATQEFQEKKQDYVAIKKVHIIYMNHLGKYKCTKKSIDCNVLHVLLELWSRSSLILGLATRGPKPKTQKVLF